MNRQMMKKIEQMQNDMINTQKEIEETLFTNTAGGGVVSVTINGAKEIKEIKIKEGFIPEDSEDLVMLCEMIVAASSQTYRDINKTTEEKMAKYQQLLGGLGGLF